MKKLLSVLLSVCLLSSMFTMFAVNTSAKKVDEHEYVSSIEFIGAENYDKATEYAENGDYTILGYTKYDSETRQYNKYYYDFNQSNGLYLHVAYKTTTDTSLAIRDMVVMKGLEWRTVNTWLNSANNCYYQAVGGIYKGTQKDRFNINEDFEDEEEIYLFVTYDAKAGNPIYNLAASGSKGHYLYGDDGMVVDLNATARTKYLYYEQVRYFSDLQLGAADDADVAGADACMNFHRLFYPETDLNELAGGDYIYLTYQLTSDASKAIRDIICLDGDYDGVDEFYNTKNGCTYTAIKGYIEDDTDTLKTINVNRNAGGDQLWLFCTTDPKAGDPITDISFYSDLLSDISDDEDDNAVSTPYGGAIDLNKKAGGSYVYILCEHTKLNTTGSMFSEGVLPYVLIGGAVIIICGVAAALVIRKKQLLKG